VTNARRGRRREGRLGPRGDRRLQGHASGDRDQTLRQQERPTGTLTLKPVAVTVGGERQPITASISGVQTKLEGRGTGVNEIAKVGAGTAAGAVVGRVLGGSSKGAIIGGIIGGAVGTQRHRDQGPGRVCCRGTAVTITLDDKFVAQS
jgi:hypothetical protein